MQGLSLDWVPGQEEATRDATRHLGQLRTRTARKITAVGDHSLFLTLVRSHTRTSRSQEVHTEVFRNKRAQRLQLTLKKRVCAQCAHTHTHAHAEQRGTMSRTSQWSSPGPTAGRDESNSPSALGSLRRRCEVPGGPEWPPAGPCCSSKVEGTEPRGPPPASMVRCEVLRLAHLSHHVQRTKRSSRRACGGDATPSPAATGERAEFRQGYAAF